MLIRYFIIFVSAIDKCFDQDLGSKVCKDFVIAIFCFDMDGDGMRGEKSIFDVNNVVLFVALVNILII